MRLFPSSLRALSSRTWFTMAVGLGLLGAQDALAAGPTFPRVSSIVDAAVDSYAIANTTKHFLYFTNIAHDLELEAPALFQEKADGTGRMTGIVRSKGNSVLRFYFDIKFGGRVVNGDANFPPAGSPKEELQPGAYAVAGGPVDPTTWYYYQTWDGVITGLSGMTGAIITTSRMGPSFQVGAGANGMNIADGVSGWFNASVVQQALNGPQLPVTFTGDANGNRRDDNTLCADEAVSDGSAHYISGHAITMPGIGNFVIDGDGSFTEYANGTALLTGTLISMVNPCDKFTMVANFSNRVNPGDPGFPPPGSPKKELKPQFYSENGGPVDTSTWHYYLNSTATLTGVCNYAGAVITLQQTGPAFQVGFGANGRNLNNGGSGWVDVFVINQPTNGPALVPSYTGDYNLDLRTECVDNPPAVSVATTTAFGQGCAGIGGFVPTLNFSGALGLGAAGSIDVASAEGGANGMFIFGPTAAQVPVGYGCSVLVNPILGYVGLFGLNGVGPGAGTYSFGFNMPLSTTVGHIFFQGVVFQSNGTYALTNAVDFSVN